jgi:hypothetical protein
MVNNRGCKFVMPDGRKCRSSALRGEDFCLFHSPDHEDQAAETQRLGGLRRRKEKTVAAAYDLEGLRSVEAVQRLLEIATLDALALENSVARVRALTYICQTGLKCLEQGEFEERLAVLESVHKGRDASPPDDFDLELEVEEDVDPKELNP